MWKYEYQAKLISIKEAAEKVESGDAGGYRAGHWLQHHRTSSTPSWIGGRN